MHFWIQWVVVLYVPRCVMWQTPSASKQMVDLENKPETSTDEEKKEQTFGLRTDQYAKKGQQVLSVNCCFINCWIRCLPATFFENTLFPSFSCFFSSLTLLILIRYLKSIRLLKYLREADSFIVIMKHKFLRCHNMESSWRVLALEMNGKDKRNDPSDNSGT